MKTSLEHPSKKQIMNAVTSRLMALRSDLVAVYVFGSYFTEDFLSDVDLGILLAENPVDPLNIELDLEMELEKTASLPVDVSILNGAPIWFCQNVILNGEVIVDARPDRRDQFEGRVLHKYFDFAHFRARYLSEFANVTP